MQLTEAACKPWVLNLFSACAQYKTSGADIVGVETDLCFYA